MNNLIDIKQLTRQNIDEIFSIANKLKEKSKKKKSKVLRGKSIANLFFENSTRTLISFELAAKHLGAHVINVNIEQSSTTKGESLKDTIQTLQAMGVDTFIVRHSENNINDDILKWLNKESTLINAGDGNNQHPTQALLDIYTILQQKKKIKNLKIAIIGDIKNSRVANSLIDILHIYDNTKINVFGPESLLPNSSSDFTISSTLQNALDNVDVIVMLRIQKERMAQQNIPDLEKYHENYGLNRKTLAFANHGCIVLHPGPINREVEISSEIADNTPSVILKQVKNGVLIRQAVLVHLMKNKKIKR